LAAISDRVLDTGAPRQLPDSIQLWKDHGFLASPRRHRREIAAHVAVCGVIEWRPGRRSSFRCKHNPGPAPRSGDELLDPRGTRHRVLQPKLEWSLHGRIARETNNG